MILIELSNQWGEGAMGPQRKIYDWLLVISYGIVSLLMFEEGSSEHDRVCYAHKKSTETWFLSMIQYNFHKLKHEVHLVLVLVTVGTDRE